MVTAITMLSQPGGHGDGHLPSGGDVPLDVLRAATSGAAELLRLDGEIGLVQPGHLADLVVVDGDPSDLRGWPSG